MHQRERERERERREKERERRESNRDRGDPIYEISGYFHQVETITDERRMLTRQI
jgi:preprotein translocase subunit YajC